MLYVFYCDVSGLLALLLSLKDITAAQNTVEWQLLLGLIDKVAMPD